MASAAPFDKVELVSDGGVGGLSPFELTPAGGTLFFAGTTPESGAELWASDGTTAGTRQVKDIDPGSSGSMFLGSSQVTEMVAIGNRILFSANTAANGTELWVSDGTAGGTQLVKEIAAGTASGNPTDLVSFKGRVFFSATPDGTGLGQVLYASDGTDAGTQVVTDVDPAADDDVQELVVAGDQLFFRANSNLWVSDGSTSSRVGPFSTACCTSDNVTTPFVALGNNLIFSIGSGSANVDNGFWITSGTRAGSTEIKDITELSPVFARPVAIGGKVYFSGSDASNSNYEPWVTDGTAAGTFQLADLDSSGASHPFNFTGVGGGKVIFGARNATSGTELYVTDGTAAGTTLLKELHAGGDGLYTVSASGPDARWAVVDGVAYFPGFGGTSNFVPYRSDGTTAGTVPVTPDQLPFFAGVNDEFVPFAGSAFFTASDGVGSSSGSNDLFKTAFAGPGGPGAGDAGPGTPGTDPACEKAKKKLKKAKKKLKKLKQDDDASAKAIKTAKKKVKKAKKKKRKACD